MSLLAWKGVREDEFYLRLCGLYQRYKAVHILVGDLQMVLKSLLYGKLGHWSWRHMDHDHHLWNQWPLLPLKSSQTWNCIVECVQRSVLKEAWCVKSTNWEAAEGVAGKVAARFCPLYNINYMLDLMCFFLAEHTLHTKKKAPQCLHENVGAPRFSGLKIVPRKHETGEIEWKKGTNGWMVKQW